MLITQQINWWASLRVAPSRPIKLVRPRNGPKNSGREKTSYFVRGQTLFEGGYQSPAQNCWVAASLSEPAPAWNTQQPVYQHGEGFLLFRHCATQTNPVMRVGTDKVAIVQTQQEAQVGRPMRSVSFLSRYAGRPMVNMGQAPYPTANSATLDVEF